MRARFALLPLAALVLTAVAGCADDEPESEFPRVVQPTETQEQPTPSESPSDSRSSRPGSGAPQVAGTVATGLAVPWGVAFLPDGDAVVTERDSRRVLRVTAQGEVTELGTIEQAAPEGEAGLLGVAVPPDFDDDPRIFLYVTTVEDNRILRVPLEGDRLGEPEAILEGIPQAPTHDGGRLAFGPDGYLYASTGENHNPELAQDMDSLGGKILRVTEEGDPAPGNPDQDSPLWSWGHRNVQGLAWDDRDRLWASEFGSSYWDELNLIRKGQNYGWPEVEGKGEIAEYVDPHLVWPTDDASPSGLAWAADHLWMAGLRGERLWRISVGRDGVAKDAKPFFIGDYGRFRTVVAAPDGSLWLTTSNKDGRGDPDEQDDRILRITP